MGVLARAWLRLNSATNSFVATLKAPALTANRSFYFLNKTGTLQLIPEINLQNVTSYTLSGTDEGDALAMNSTSANTVTIPLNCTVKQMLIGQWNTGVTTITPASGVTINGSTSSKVIQARYQMVNLFQVSSNTYWIPNT